MANQNSTLIQTITFCIEKQLYGIDILQLDEILPMLEIKSIPKGPGFLEGVVNLRGDIIPVMDLRKFFGYSREEYSLETRILVASFQDRRLGLIADGVKNIKEFSASEIHTSVVESQQARFIERIAKLPTGEIIQLITVSKILDQKLLNQLTKLSVDFDQNNGEE